MKIVARNLNDQNEELLERITALEKERGSDVSRHFKVGDRVKVLKPTCPGRNREIIPADKFATVIKVSENYAISSSLVSL